MKKRDYRLVEFIPDYSPSNYRELEKNKGLFHFWQKYVESDGHETYTALIEDLSNGKLIKNDPEDIRFLTDKESVAFWSDADNAQIW